MTGRIVGKDKQSIVIDDNLKAGSGVRFVDGDVHIALTNASRGRIVIGKINILFQFVSNHDEAAAARLIYQPSGFKDKFLEIVPRMLWYALIFSFLASCSLMRASNLLRASLICCSIYILLKSLI